MQVRPFVLGDKFQVVDIFMSSLISWAKTMEAPGLSRDLLDYEERMMQSPGYQRFKEKYAKKA